MRVVLIALVVLLACSGPGARLGYKVYVTNYDSSTVTVIRPTSRFPARRVKVGREPTYVTATHQGDLVLVTNTGDSTVTFIDPANDSVLGTTRVSGLLKGIEVDPRDRYALVADEANARVAVIDLKTRQVMKRIRVNAEPHNFAFADEFDRAFVTCAGANSVDIIDLGRLDKVGSIPSCPEPHNLVFARGWLVVTSRRLPWVYFSSGSRVFDSVRVSTGLHGIAADPEGTMLYVSGIGDNVVTTIDLADRRTVQTVRVGPGPHGVCVSPEGLLVYVACACAGEVMVSTVHEMHAAEVRSPGFPFWAAIARLPATGALKPKPPYTDIRADELAEMMKHKDFLLLNVHVPDEGQIPGTDLHVPFNKIAENADKFPKDKTEKIVVYGAGGARSVKAARKLAELGYTNIFNLKHGFVQWQARGLPFTPAR